jgi:Mrp family chromosome partitioning ATPase
VLNKSSDQWDDGPSLLASLWRYRWVVLAGVLLGGLVGYGLSVRQPRQYEATARLIISAPAPPDGAPAVDADRYLRNQVQFISSSPVIFRAAEIARLPARTWRDTLAVDAGKGSDLIVIRVRASTGREAAKVANSVVLAYQEVWSRRVREQNLAVQERLKVTTDKLRARLADLNARLQGSGGDDPVLNVQREATKERLREIVTEATKASIAASSAGPLIQMSEKAAPAAQPVEPRPRRTAAGGALFGLFAISALVWLLHWRQLQAPQPEAPDEAGPDQPPAVIDLPGENVPVLGAIPDFSGVGVDGPVPTVTAPQSIAARSYETVSERLKFAAKELQQKIVLVTSPEPGDGKTLTVLNVGIAAGQSGQSMVAVDADLRRRSLSELCNINGRVGLSDMVRGNHHMTTGQFTWLVEFPGILVIPGGSHVRDATSVFRASSFGAAMSTLREHGDLILIDSPALSEGPDVLEIAQHVDAAVLVVNSRTPLGVLRAARQRLDSVGIPVLGYVVNGEVSGGQVKRQANGSSPAREHGLHPATDTGLEWGSAR